jgi:hypothetical protein
MGSITHEWNRRGVQRLIVDAENLLSFLNSALGNPDPNERAHALRNGRLIYKELLSRRKNFLLPSVSTAAIEKLLDEIRAVIRRLFERRSGV